MTPTIESITRDDDFGEFLGTLWRVALPFATFFAFLVAASPLSDWLVYSARIFLALLFAIALGVMGADIKKSGGILPWLTEK